MTPPIEDSIENKLNTLFNKPAGDKAFYLRSELEPGLLTLIESEKAKHAAYVIGENEYYREHYSFVITESQHEEIEEKIARDDLRREQRKRAGL